MGGGLAVFDIDMTLTRTNDVDNECYLRAVREVLDLDITPDRCGWDSVMATGAWAASAHP